MSEVSGLFTLDININKIKRPFDKSVVNRETFIKHDNAGIIIINKSFNSYLYEIALIITSIKRNIKPIIIKPVMPNAATPSVRKKLAFAFIFPLATTTPKGSLYG